MRMIGKTAGLCLVSMLVMGVALAGNASAVRSWVVCKAEEKGSFENSSCTKVNTTGGWEWQDVTGTEKVKLVGLTLTLRDTKTALGVAEVQCYGKGSMGEGVVEAGGKGKVRVAEYEKAKENCRGVKVCEKEGVEEVKGVNFPWNTELFETEKKILTKILASTSGKEPGWKIKCNTIGGPQTDECLSEGEAERVELKNEVSSGTVLGRFESAHKLKCSLGGKGSGEVTGSVKTGGEKGFRVEKVPQFKMSSNWNGMPLEELQRADLEITNESGVKEKPWLIILHRTPVDWEFLNGETCANEEYEINQTCVITAIYLHEAADELRAVVEDINGGRSGVRIVGK
jgi:hypothetical protein